MNQFFYESRGKEKVKDLMREGQQSQAFHRSGAPKVGGGAVPKLVAGLLAILGLISLLMR